MKNKIAEIVRLQNRFGLYTHTKPDGDALGSLLALGLALEKLGKSVHYCSEGMPSLDFLPGYAKLEAEACHDVDVIIYVDCANCERNALQTSAARDERNFPPPMIINIDHHISNTQFGDVYWIDPASSSVGEMLWFLFEEMGITVDYDMAMNLYTSIVTDTGRFAFYNTTRRTHEVAGRLLETGIEVGPLHTRLFDEKTLPQIKLLAQALNGLYLTGEGRIAVMGLKNEDFTRLGLDSNSSEGFIQMAMDIEGVQAAVLLKESEPGVLKVSLRSRGQIDVNWLASQFGGGGHVRAAGCTLRMPFDQGTALVQTAILQMLDEI